MAKFLWERIWKISTRNARTRRRDKHNLLHQKSDIPADRQGVVTYVSFVCNYRPKKEEKERTHLVIGGNGINYPGDAGTPTADLLTIKLLANSVVSTKNTKMLTMDLKDFYLNTPMERSEYI